MNGFDRAQRAHDNASPPEPDWVGEEDVTCGTERGRKVLTVEMERLINAMDAPPTVTWVYPTEQDRLDAELSYLRGMVGRLAKMMDAVEATDLECSFDGTADVVLMGGRLLWTCPVCGEEHDEDAADRYERDPDDYRDEQMERAAEDRFGDEP